MSDIVKIAMIVAAAAVCITALIVDVFAGLLIVCAILCVYYFINS